MTKRPHFFSSSSSLFFFVPFHHSPLLPLLLLPVLVLLLLLPSHLFAVTTTTTHCLFTQPCRLQHVAASSAVRVIRHHELDHAVLASRATNAKSPYRLLYSSLLVIVSFVMVRTVIASAYYATVVWDANERKERR